MVRAGEGSQVQNTQASAFKPHKVMPSLDLGFSGRERERGGEGELLWRD